MRNPCLDIPMMSSRVTEAQAEVVKLHVKQALSMDIPTNNIEFEKHFSNIMDSMIYQLNVRMLQMDGEVDVHEYPGNFLVPATWWDHFKMRFFPKWKRKTMRLCYVSKTTVKKIHVCPHLPIDDNYKHFRFLMYGDTGKIRN